MQGYIVRNAAPSQMAQRGFGAFFSCCAVVFVVLVGSGYSAGADLAADFSSVNNPNGQWAFGYKLIADGPTVFTPFADVSPGLVPGIDVWHGTSQIGVLLPAVTKNVTGGTVSDGFSTWFPGQVLTHPGTAYDALIQWTAPADGTYQIDASFQGLSLSGTSSLVSVYHDGTSLYSDPLNGYLTVDTFPTTYESFLAGQKLTFIINKDINDYFGDSTGIAATIVAVPEPGVLSLMPIAFIALRRSRTSRRMSKAHD